ncbi:MAG: hypothetical protein QNJ62_11650 [Methyloceanibacter sp.]|nr:hypothetical protein [Methyloceanibacter sp.]
MGVRVFLSAALMLLTTIAFAEHAISLDANTAPAPAAEGAAQPVPTKKPATQPAPATTKPAPLRTATARPTANAKVALPSELDVYLVQAGTREVCDTFNFGGGDVRTECRVEPLPARAENPALRGICITRYGNRTCY